MGAFESFDAFLAMGGYAPFVWSSFGLAALVLIINVVLPMLEARRLRARIARQHKLAERST